MSRILPFLILSCLVSSASLGHDPGPAVLSGPAEQIAAAPLDLNTATVEQLDELPRIGPALAGRIVAYRDQQGPFTRIEQLAEVKGIGPQTLEKLRPLLTVR